MLGDEVRFVKGYDSRADEEVWDRIYVTTLFTFDFDLDVETINHYKLLVDNVNGLYAGGIMASLLTEKLSEAAGIDKGHILTGLFTDTSLVGDANDINIDELPLDYDILEQIDYKYPAGENYFAYTTGGCPNHCPFCAVHVLEPRFQVKRELIMFRSHFEENGITTEWKSLYRKLDVSQKEQLMELVSLKVNELKCVPWPNELKDILPYYLIKYNGKTETLSEKYIQLSLMEDSDVVIED